MIATTQPAPTPRTNDAARRVLQRVGIDLFEAPSAGCCGAVPQLEISQRLLDRKQATFSIDEPEQIVTASIGCQLHLGAKADVSVKHWIELFDHG